MAPKKKRSSPAKDAREGKKQATLTFNKPSQKSDAVLEQEAAPRKFDSSLSDLQRLADIYCQQWVEKCEPKRDDHRGSEANTTTVREDVNLDATGMKFIDAFKHAMQQAVVQDEMMDPAMLEMLVLIMRNDAIHAHTRVARAAYSTMCSYLDAFPIAKVMNHSEGSSSFEGKPYVVMNPTAAWTPLTTNQKSLTAKYLLVPDISISGRNYKIDTEASLNTRHLPDNKFRSPYEFLFHGIKAGVDSAKFDLNGDLMLLKYVLSVVEQDLDCRLHVHSAYADNSEENGVQDKRRAVLENSLAWRIFTCPLTDHMQRHRMVKAIMELIVADVADVDLEAIVDEPEEDAPAGACVFTRRELAAIASRLLNCMLKIYGAAEAAGAFLCTSKHRSHHQNQRTVMDEFMLKQFFSKEAVCKTPDACKAFLNSLAPRDALRLLGLFIAQQFNNTYDKEAKGGLHGLIKANAILNRGSDAAGFIEVDMVEAVTSINMDPGRAVKVYKAAGYLTMVVSGIASAAHALTVQGEPLPCGESSPAALWGALQEAVKNVAGKVKESGGSAGSMVNHGALADLVATHTVLKTVTAAA